VERNHKAGQNPPRVVAPTEEEEEEEEEVVVVVNNDYETKEERTSGTRFCAYFMDSPYTPRTT
jgi:hypothetical protein